MFSESTLPSDTHTLGILTTKESKLSIQYSRAKEHNGHGHPGCAGQWTNRQGCNQTEPKQPERPEWATEQAEPSMQATEPSPSGGSARFAWFDYRPGGGRRNKTMF